MNINDFREPTQHPYDLLGNYEKEEVLALALQKAMEAGDLYAEVTFQFNHDDMVDTGLFEKVSETSYKLTKKAVGLLYSVYGV